MRPMLARTVGPKFNRFPCYLQPKLNGVRALYQNGRFQSRDEHLWPEDFLAHLSTPLRSICNPSLLLDGELYVHGWRLQRINRAVAINATERGPIEDTLKVEYHVFDLVDTTIPFSRRWVEYAFKELQLAQLDQVKAVALELVDNRMQVDICFNRYISLGYEGVMLRPDGCYEPQNPTQRSAYLWKLKSWTDGEYRCVGITPGEGKASNGIGALILTTPLGELFHCGTGYDDEERKHLLAHPPLGRLVRVRFNSTTAKGVPTPCSFLAVMP